METFEDIVTRLVNDVVNYTDLGLSKLEALKIVKESTCASVVAWKEVTDRILYCPQCEDYPLNDPPYFG